MAEEHQDGDQPSLELPSLFRRRKGVREPEPTPVELVETPKPTRGPQPPPVELAETPDVTRTPQPSPVEPVETPKPTRGPQPPPVELVETPDVTRTSQPSPVEPVETPHPRLTPLLAAIVTGTVTGLLGVGLTWLGLRGCSAVRDTSSCGDPGFLLLMAIVVVMAAAGRTLLRTWRVPDPGSTSILATALMAVLTMLFLMGSLEDTWTVVVLPVLGAVTFALAQWVTSGNTSPGDRIR